MQSRFLIAGAGALLLASPAMAQGVQLRSVASPDSGRLIYAYQTEAGVSRISIDPTTLVQDIERARKRAPQKKAAVKSAPVAAPIALQKPAETAQPAMAKAEIETPAAETSPATREAKKVRVIPLYNLPQAD